MSTSTIFRFAAGVAILIIVVSAWFTARVKQQRRDLMLAISMSVGAELVHGPNSRTLTGSTPESQADIKLIQGSPTRAIVRAGDDKPPLGDGSAYARLMLT